eukprot:GILJ01012000.1.p1 GENE.GILJ01012000.1~~GILJ01012000.1.p1  ORF type:complete len:212 (-),score=24.05 GILJ01012000.1:44-679(-)
MSASLFALKTKKHGGSFGLFLKLHTSVCMSIFSVFVARRNIAEVIRTKKFRILDTVQFTSVASCIGRSIHAALVLAKVNVDPSQRSVSRTITFLAFSLPWILANLSCVFTAKFLLGVASALKSLRAKPPKAHGVDAIAVIIFVSVLGHSLAESLIVDDLNYWMTRSFGLMWFVLLLASGSVILYYGRNLWSFLKDGTGDRRIRIRVCSFLL